MRTTKRLGRWLISVAGTLAVLAWTAAGLALPAAASGGTLTLKVCGVWSQDRGPFRAVASSPFGWDVQCGSRGNGLELWFGTGAGSVKRGAAARWSATAPPGIAIARADVSRLASRGVGSADG